MVSQQLIIQCDVYAVCYYIHVSNKSQYLKNEERYGKTIDGVPLLFNTLSAQRVQAWPKGLLYKYL